MEEKIIKRPLLLIAGGFVLGEVLILLHLLAVWQIVGIAALVCGAAIGWIILRSRSGFLWLLLLCASLSAGSGRGAIVRSRTEAAESRLPEKGQGQVAGRISDLEMRNGIWNIELSDALVWSGQTWMTVGGILLSCDENKLTGLAQELKVGMSVIVEGRIQRFTIPGNPGEFHSRNYYRSLGISGRVSVTSLSVRDYQYNHVRQALYQLRGKAKETLNQIAGEAESGIFQATILGDKTELGTDIKELYQRGGIAHLLALSGLHLSLIGTAVYGGLRKSGAGFLVSGLAGTLFICAYVVLTGSSVSVIRAAVMMICSFLAAYKGRHYDLLSACGLALVGLSWHQPYLLFQAGFQLSFGAIAGIGFLYPVLSEKKQSSLAQAARISASIHLATLPVVLFHYYQISVYGFLLNLIVIPLMSIVIASGIGGILLARIHLLPGRFVIGSGHMILQLYELLCRLTEGLPYAVWITGCPQWWQIGIYYLAVTIAFNIRKAPKVRIGLLVAVQLLLLIPLPVRGLQVTFLDVGQGDGIFLRTSRYTVLADAGSSDISLMGKYRLETFLKHQGVSVLDYILISHGDSDHMNGVEYLLAEGKDIAIYNLILPIAGKTDPVYEGICELADRRGTKVYWMKQGDAVRLDDLTVICLYPGEKASPLDRNAQSLVLHVQYQDFQMLLTGDIGAPEEQQLLAMEEFSQLLAGVQVLKVAHHGSRFSTSAPWLSQVKPDWAVISYGKSNSYGHPGSEVITRLKEQQTIIFETAHNGAITLYTDGNTIEWKTFR